MENILRYEDFLEDKPKYTFTEEFANTVKTDIITSSNMEEVFSFAMDFLIHCGYSKDMIDELYESWKES